MKVIANGPTGTLGILEQRALSAVSACLHSEREGWRARGLSDPVNATNLSKRKLGDFDFQHAGQLRVTAYAAHAGELSSIYVESHLRTVRRVLPLRTEEWQGIADPADWSVCLNFVSHRLGGNLPHDFGPPGHAITLRYLTFSEFFASLRPTTAQLNAIMQGMHRGVAEERTPRPVRERYRELLRGL